MIQQLYRESWLDYMQTISQQRPAATAQTQLRDFDDVDKQNQIESGFEKVLGYIFHIIKYNSILLPPVVTTVQRTQTIHQGSVLSVSKSKGLTMKLKDCFKLINHRNRSILQFLYLRPLTVIVFLRLILIISKYFLLRNG